MNKKESSTKEALIVSTMELLWERGYVGMSPKAILRHADVGQGSMYHHFTGKAELARDAIGRSADNLQAQAALQLSVPGTALAKIDAFLARERDILRGCQIGRLAHDPDIIDTEMLRVQLAQAFEGVRRLLAAVLVDGVAKGELPVSLNPELTAETILATLQGGYVLARAAHSDAPFRSAIGGLQAMLRALECGAAARATAQ